MSNERKGERVSYMKIYEGSGPSFNEISGTIVESKFSSWEGTTYHTIDLDKPIVNSRGDRKYKVVVSEWWNGEGMDVNFTNERDKIISLHYDEIEALVIAAKIVGLIDLKSIKKRVKQIQRETQERKQHLQNVRDEILGKDL